MKPFVQYSHVGKMPRNSSIAPESNIQSSIKEQSKIEEIKREEIKREEFKREEFKREHNKLPNEDFIFTCPHCDMFIEVKSNEVNCCIFRHAYFFQKTDKGEIVLLNQLNPHASKDVCDSLIAEGRIYGCGKPFRIIKNEEGFSVEKCDYI
jgi:hypothetical protein